MEINVSKGIFKRSLALTMALLIALSGMWTGLASVSLAVEEEFTAQVTDGNVRATYYSSTNDIEVGQTKTVTIHSNQITYLKFTPAYSGRYNFYSSGSGDHYGYLYNENKYELASDDDSGGYREFSVTYELEAGKTYYWGARYYSRENSGSYDVTLVYLDCNHSNTVEVEGVAPTCTTDGYTDGINCAVCNSWISGREFLPATHIESNGKTVAAKAKSCYEDGYSEGIWCDECNRWITDVIKYPASHTDSDNDDYCDECESPMPISSGYCGEYEYIGSISGYGSWKDTAKYYYYADGVLEIFGEGAIGDYAFKYDDGIEYLVIHEGITEIGYEAFYDCDNIKTVNLPDTLTTIDSRAFYSCDNIEEIYLPESVSYIGSSAFEYCYNLKEITILNSDCTIYYSNYTIYSGATIYGHEGSTAQSYAEFYNRTFLCCCLHNNTVEIESVAATCTEVGYTEGIKCTDCERWVSGHNVIPKTHLQSNDKNIDAVDATCYENGNEAGIWCDECNCWISGGNKIIASHIDENSDGVCERCEKSMPSSSGSCGGNGNEDDGYDGSAKYYFYSDGTLEIYGEGEIAEWRFEDNDNITSVIIYEGITDIEYDAFYDCDNIKTVKLPDTLTTIGSSAFYSCDKLESILLPESVTSIGSSAFRYCNSLKEISILNSNCDIYDSSYTIYSGATIYGHEGSTAESYADDYYRSFLTYCPHNNPEVIPAVPVNCNSDGYTEGVKCPDCERWLSGHEVIFATHIEANEREIEAIPVTCYGNGQAAGVWCDECDYWISGGNKIIASHIDEDDDGICERCEKSMPSSSGTCGGYYDDEEDGYDGSAKYYLYPDGTLEIYGEGVVGECAFDFNDYITSVIIHEGITGIDYEAFYDCDGIVSVFIPESVSYIRSYAFCSCDNLKEITILNENCTIYNSSSTIYSGATIYGKEGSTAETYAKYYNKKFLVYCPHNNTVNVPAEEPTCYESGYSAGVKCTDCGRWVSGGEIIPATHPDEERDNICDICLKTLPVTTGTCGGNYNDDCGSGCSSYYDGAAKYYLYADGTLEIYGEGEIYECAFDDNDSITSVIIHEGITGIDYEAFYDCDNIKTVKIPDTLTTIGSSAFYSCDNLESILLPESVTSIGSSAFEYCYNLKEISILNADCDIYDYYDTIQYGATICGKEGSTAQSYAEEYDRTFLTYCPHNNPEVIPEVPATCITDGYTEGVKCPDCERWLSGYERILAAHKDSNKDGKCDNCKKSSPVSSGYCGGYYDEDDDEYYTDNEVRYYLYADGTLEIYGKGEIKYYAFAKNEDIKSVIIHEGITKINYEAFEECSNLASVTLPEGVTSIGRHAFNNCTSLASVTLPEGVTSIGYSAFYNCSSLTSITIPEGVTSIGSYAFYNCSSLASITIPSTVTSIDEGVFYNCSSLTSITLPEGVTSIGSEAFYNCSSLTSITIPEGVTSIGSYAFYNCTSLASITIPEGITSIGDCSFYNCSSLTSITIPEGVTSIGDCSFYNCSSLTSITIPEGVTSIGSYAFFNCSSLASITIPSTVTSIDEGVFYNCTSLTSITIPEGVTSIGSEAFYNCSSLTSITLPEGVTSIGSEAFRNCTSLTSITLPEGVTSIGGYSFYNCSSLASITIPSTVTSIRDYAFNGCTVLKKVYAADIESWMNISFGYSATPTLYGAELYFDNKLVTEIVIPDGITAINDYAFYGCSGIESVTIPAGVTSIGSHAFNSCNSLESITIPEGVTSIGNYAFSYCDSLESITIPKGVKTIGSYAFSNCDSLVNVTIPEGVTIIGENAFRECDSLVSVVIPDSVTEIGNSAFYDCDKLETAVIGNGVKTIGTSAFLYCYNLKEITIPESVTNIGSSAFYGCAFYRMTIPEAVTNIGGSCFDGDVVLYGKKGSYGISWAEKKGYFYVVTDAKDSDSIFSGRAGGSLDWRLDKRTGVLEISGSGEMISYSQAKAPWYDYRYYVKEIRIPDTVTAIGTYAFENCYNLQNVTIPDSITTIGSCAFEDCYGLEAVTLGSGVTSIQSGAFYDCPRIKSVYAKDIESWLKISFANSNSNPLNPGADLYFGGKLATDIVIPESIETVNYCAFYNCNSIKKVTIPDSVSKINSYVFYGCDNLETVTIGNGVTSVGSNAFSYCKALKDLTIGNNVSTISNSAFYACESLEKVTIPYTVKNIYSSAFSGCKNLTEVIIFSPDGAFDTECGFNYNQTIYGFIGSTAEAFAKQIGAEFIDLETIHTHEYVKSEVRGYCSYEQCWCKMVKGVVHTDADYNGVCDNCKKSSNDIDVNETVNGRRYYEGGALWYLFTAAKEGRYTITLDKESTIRIYNENKTDYSHWSYNEYSYTCNLKAGQRIYWYVYPNISSSDIAYVDVNVTLTFAESHEHVYTSKITKDPTCTENGVKTYTCSCGDSYTSTVWSNGHEYGGWYVSKFGSCNATTIITRDCKNCDHKDEMVFAATGEHTPEKTVIRATDTHNGSIVTRCSVCGTKISSSTVYQISSVSLSATKYTYDGKAKTPSVTVKDSKGKTLKKDTDYTVTYASGRKNVGKYAVTVKFKGNYGGTEKLSFTIVPATPKSFSYTAASTTSVKLSWKAVSGATGYRVYMYNTSTKKYQSVAILEGKTSLTVSSLKAGTSYKFKIKAFAEVGDDTFFWSNASSELVAYTKPATPTLKASSSKKGTASLSWTNVAGETGYQVYYATSKSGTYKSLGSYKANVVKASKSKLTSGKTYYFKVRAYTKTSSGTIYSAWSSVKSVKVK